MPEPNLPAVNTNEYLWWQAGALAECRARDEGLTHAAKEVRDVLEGFARLHNIYDQEQLALTLAKIFCPDKLKRGYR
jgi:hypothetical protein